MLHFALSTVGISAIMLCFNGKVLSLEQNSTEPSKHYYQPNVISSKPSQPVTIDVPPLVLPVNFNFWSKSSSDFLPNYLNSQYKTQVPSTTVPPPAKTEEPLERPMWTKPNGPKDSISLPEQFDSLRITTDELMPQFNSLPSLKTNNQTASTSEKARKKWFVAIPLFYMEPKLNSSEVFAKPSSGTNTSEKVNLDDAPVSSSKYVPLILTNWPVDSQVVSKHEPIGQMVQFDGQS